MRPLALAIAAGLMGSAALVVSCGDLFHDTSWPTVCDDDASAPGCSSGDTTGPGSTTHASSSSSGGAGAGGAGGTGGNGGSTGSGGDPCHGYCTAVMSACVMPAPVQYEDMTSCLQVCALLPHVNTPGANDIACRQDFADQAATEPLIDCTPAGPGGDGKCGTVCDAYCAIMAQRCNGAFPAQTPCGDTCSNSPDYDATPKYDTSQQTGATLSCHLYWAVRAVTDDSATNCDNAGPSSPVCVVPTDM